MSLMSWGSIRSFGGKTRAPIIDVLGWDDDVGRKLPVMKPAEDRDRLVGVGVLTEGSSRRLPKDGIGWGSPSCANCTNTTTTTTTLTSPTQFIWPDAIARVDARANEAEATAVLYTSDVRCGPGSRNGDGSPPPVFRPASRVAGERLIDFRVWRWGDL